MVKTFENSRIRVWESYLVNNPRQRDYCDRNVAIVQIEHAGGDDYIVEIVDKKPNGDAEEED